jgi:hypothetical protein
MDRRGQFWKRLRSTKDCNARRRRILGVADPHYYVYILSPVLLAIWTGRV